MSAITASPSPIPRGFFSSPSAAAPALVTAASKPVVGFHGAVSDFKRRLIEATLAQAGGNRTRAAKALGLQRTYLLRLMREFEIHAPPSPATLAGRTGANQSGLPPQTR